MKKSDLKQIIREEIQKVLKEEYETNLMTRLEADPNLEGPNEYGRYRLKHPTSKSDFIDFVYDEKRGIGVKQVNGHHLPSQLLKSLGFKETRTWTAGVDSYIYDGNYNPNYLTDEEMSQLIDEWGKGFSSYAKSFADFYKDRDPD